MKNLIFPLIVIVALGTGVGRAQNAVPWPQVVVSEPFHAGDDVVKDMRHPQPHGPKFSGSFTLPPTLKPGPAMSVVVELTVAGITPMTGRTQLRAEKDGKALARLLVNGQEVAVLNSLVKGVHSNELAQTVKVPVAGKFLREGSNEIVIEPGGGKGKEGLDDCEVLGLTVSSPAN